MICIKKILLYVSILLLTGCQFTNETSTEKSVYEYLQRIYPGENFTIQFYKDVTLQSPTGGCGEVPGHTWSVISKSTGLSFYVQDDYYFNSFTCNYSLADNYFTAYLSNTIKKIDDSRVILDISGHENDIVDAKSGYGSLYSSSAINLDLNNFTSEQELANVAVSTRQIILSDEFLKNRMPEYFWFNIYHGDTIICSINFYSADNVDYIKNKITESN